MPTAYDTTAAHRGNFAKAGKTNKHAAIAAHKRSFCNLDIVFSNLEYF